MAEKHVLPSAEQITKIVVGLFGEDAIVRTAKSPCDLNDPIVVAKYTNDESELQRLVVCDVAFANNAGAALTMISPGVVADAIKAKEIPDNICDNFREVMNIFVNAFPETSRGRLVLNGINLPAETKDEPTTKAIAAPVERVDFEVTVPRYGAGRLTLLAC
jgi:hypothetical protein